MRRRNCLLFAAYLAFLAVNSLSSVAATAGAPSETGDLESQIFSSRLAIKSGRFVVNEVLEVVAEKRKVSYRIETNLDGQNVSEFRTAIESGLINVTCYNADSVYLYGTGGIGKPPLVIFPIKSHDAKRDVVCDPLKLMFLPLDYEAATGHPRDEYLAAKDRSDFSTKRTQWQGLEAIRVSFNRLWKKGQSSVSYVVVPSRSYNIVEMTSSFGEAEKKAEFNVTCTLSLIGTDMWFPDHISHFEKRGDVTVRREELSVQTSKINEPIPSDVFTLRGLGIPAGTRVVQVAETSGMDMKNSDANAVKGQQSLKKGTNLKFDGEKVVPMTKEDVISFVSTPPQKPNYSRRAWYMGISAAIFAVTAFVLLWFNRRRKHSR